MWELGFRAWGLGFGVLESGSWGVGFSVSGCGSWGIGC